MKDVDGNIDLAFGLVVPDDGQAGLAKGAFFRERDALNGCGPSRGSNLAHAPTLSPAVTFCFARLARRRYWAIAGLSCHVPTRDRPLNVVALAGC